MPPARRIPRSFVINQKPLGKEFIQLIAADSDEPILIHRAIAERGCRRIRTALKPGGFSESESGTIRMLGHKRQAVELYVEYLYSGAVGLLPEDTNPAASHAETVEAVKNNRRSRRPESTAKIHHNRRTCHTGSKLQWSL